jgi:tetratricopeptide (TPR) repeat protein
VAGRSLLGFGPLLHYFLGLILKDLESPLSKSFWSLAAALIHPDRPSAVHVATSAVVFILLICLHAQGQAGGHTLFGDIKVDESQTAGLNPISLHVLLYSEDGRMLSRQTVPANGRYRFLDLRDGRYEVAVEVENIEVARVRVIVSAPFKTDFRQDLEFEWRDRSAGARAAVISAADLYNRSTANADLLRKATAASEKKKYAQAISLLRQIVERDPKDFPAWTELGTMYFIEKNFEQAEDAFIEALKRNPDYAVALISLGRVRIVRKNFNGAIEVLSHAVRVQPASAQANYFLGEAYLQVKLGSKAVPYLNEAIRLDPAGMADAHLRLAALYNARDMKDKAAAEYAAFLKQRPDYADRKRLEQYIAAYRK